MVLSRFKPKAFISSLGFLAGLLPKASTSSLGFCLLIRGFRGLGFGASVISGLWFRKRELDVCSVPSTLYS